MMLASALDSIGIIDAAIVALLGYAVVFFGLILLMCVIICMGKIFIAKDKKAAAKAAAANGVYTATIDGKAVTVEVSGNGDYTAKVGGKSFTVKVGEGAAAPAAAAAPAGNGEGKPVAAPLPGTVMKINVAVGDQVEADTTLLILEAVKMENEIKAGFAGTVKEISVAQGGVVAAGDTLVVIG